MDISEELNREAEKAAEALVNKWEDSDELSRLIAERLRQVPVGSIIAWHWDIHRQDNVSQRPLRIRYPDETPPEGWLPCDGRIVNDKDSILDGTRLPNLNDTPHGYKGGRFLRGGRTSGKEQDGTTMPVFTEYSEGAVFIGKKLASPAYSFEDGSIQSDPAGRMSITLNPDRPIPHAYAIKVRPVGMTVVWIIRVK